MNQGSLFIGQPVMSQLLHMVPRWLVEIQPGGIYTMTNGAGVYHENVPYGTYTIAQQSLELAEHYVGSPQSFTLSGSLLNAVRNFADTALTERDVQLALHSTAARPGFEMSYHICVDHLTAGVTGNMTVTLTFDPTVTFISRTPTPSTVTTNTVTWNTSQLTSFADRTFSARFQVPPDVGLIGTDLAAAASVSIAQPESITTNNTDTHTRTVTGSFDPNAKEANTSSGLSDVFYVIDADEWIDYTIQFQNTGTDTAFFVTITDTMPAVLDPLTFQRGAVSHNCITDMSGAGLLRFSFPNVLLPDSNVNEPRSHGFVSFRKRPRLPILPGTVITNIANIFFDYNPAIITEPSVLGAEFSTGIDHPSTGSGRQLVVMPHPALDRISVRIDDAASLTGMKSLAWMADASYPLWRMGAALNSRSMRFLPAPMCSGLLQRPTRSFITASSNNDQHASPHPFPSSAGLQ